MGAVPRRGRPVASAAVTMIPDAVLDPSSAFIEGPGGLRLLAADASFDPLDLVRAGSHLFGRAVYCSAPTGDAVAGLGTAVRMTATGGGRLDDLAAQVAALDLPPPFRFLVGFAFGEDDPRTDPWSGFAGAEAVVPMVTAVRRGGKTKLCIAAPAGADRAALSNLLASLRTPPDPVSTDLGDHVIESHPHVSDWRTSVAEAVSAIRDGAFRKVVLARSVIVRSAVGPRPFDLVHHLAVTNPLCHVFGWRSGEATFLGASPELLVGIRGGVVLSNPLAGSAPRGEDEAEDRAVGEALMASAKDRLEHALVVEHVADRLSAFSRTLSVPAAPSLRRVATVQHLSTDIKGSLDAPVGILDVASALHPTPAVGGTPREAALAFIDKVENVDRGWYSGGIGWVGPGGDGEIALGLRCALVRGTTARIYAGNGIVAESDPEAELLETRLKLTPLLELLAAS